MIKNFLYNSGYQILMIIIPIITNPYLARVLGADAIGINSYTNSVITLFSVFGLLGLTNYSNREIAYSRAKGKEEMSRTFISLVIMRMALLVICLLVYFSMMSVAEYRYYFRLQIFYLVYYFIDVSWFFLGIENMKIVVVRNSIVKLVSTILIFMVVKGESDLGKYILINGGSMFFGACIVLPQLKKYVHFVPVQRRDITKHIVPMLKIFLPQVASSLYSLLDKTMIKWLTQDVRLVGFYDQSQSLSKVPLVVASSLSTVMLPRVSAEYSLGNIEKIKGYLEIAFKYVVNLAYPVMFGMIGISSILIQWYLGDKYMECILLLRMLCLTIVPIYMTYVTGVIYMTAFNKTREMTISYIIAAIVNLSLNFLLIPKFGAAGACVGTILAEFIVIVVQYFCMCKNMGSMHLLQKGWKSMIASVVMFGVVWYLGEIMRISIVTTLIQAVVGVCIYTVIMCLLKAEVVYDVINLGKKFLIKSGSVSK